MTSFFVDFRLAPCSQSEALAVRHGAQTLYDGKAGTYLYRESYAPDCWLAPAKPVPFRLGHGGDTVGQVVVIASHNKWHVGSAVIEDGPRQAFARKLIKVGAHVSLGARSIRRDDDSDLCVVRHRLCRLDEVALVREGEVPGFLEAKITRVYEPTPGRATRAADGLARTVDGITLQPGDELEDRERGVVFRNVAGKIEQRKLLRVAVRAKRETPLSYRETNGQEWLLEAPTAADHDHVETLRRTGRLAWAR